MRLENGVEAWDFGSSQYWNDEVKNVQYNIIKHKRWNLADKNDTPITTTYPPKLDETTELQTTEASYYMSLIGIIRWFVDLG